MIKLFDLLPEDVRGKGTGSVRPGGGPLGRPPELLPFKGAPMGEEAEEQDEAWEYKPPKLKGHDAGDVWKTKKGSKSKFGAMNQVNLVRYFNSRKDAEEWAKGEHPASYSGW